MVTSLFGDTFWFSSTPLLMVGLLAATVVLAWDWRITLPAIFLVQWGMGQISTQRALIPTQWSSVFSWVVAACMLIFFLSIMQSKKRAETGRLGTLFFRSLLLGLAAFLFYSTELDTLLPLVEGDMTRLILWVAACALFTIANTSDALNSGLALMLWLIGSEFALLAITPASLMVVLLGILFLVVALACSYLIAAENLGLAKARQPLTDVTFPANPTAEPPSLADRLIALRNWVVAQRRSVQRGNQS